MPHRPATTLLSFSLLCRSGASFVVLRFDVRDEDSKVRTVALTPAARCTPLRVAYDDPAVLASFQDAHRAEVDTQGAPLAPVGEYRDATARKSTFPTGVTCFSGGVHFSHKNLLVLLCIAQDWAVCPIAASREAVQRSVLSHG